MKVLIKTIAEMLEDPDVLVNRDALQKNGTEVFFRGSNMEEELCGKTLEVDEELEGQHWPYLINDFFVPAFAVKEVLRDED